MKSRFELEIQCQSCASVLPVTLQATDGIEDAVLDGSTLTVEFDADTVSSSLIATMLEESGYTVEEQQMSEDI